MTTSKPAFTRMRLLVSVACAAVAAAATLAAGAHAYTFGEPGVRSTGPEVKVFDWWTQSCRDDDIPDQPARAFRDADGKVNLIDSHHTVRRKVGDSLATAAHSCSSILGSGVNSNPAMYDDREWLASTWTSDGTTVYGFIHAEYQGWMWGPGHCVRDGEPFSERQKCWYNAITFGRSTNGGASFSHTAPPTHYLAGAPYRYERGIGPIGFFQPSNVVRGRDGFHYMIVHVEGGQGVQPTGSCLWRTPDVSDPAAWRAWDGTGFTVRFRDPYLHSYNPAEGVCAPVPGIGTLSESLTWSTYLKKWVLVGSADNADGVSGPGFYYLTSDDLVNWSSAKLVMGGELPWTYRCEDGAEFLRDPSLLDDDSASRNFDTIGQRPYIFFTRFNITHNSATDCFQSLNRDLIRIPLEFSNRQPGGPTARLDASTQAPQTGGSVTFDASGSADSDGSITAYKWDLDGDGTFERDTGTNPVVTSTYPAPGQVTVTLRVCDNAGKATDDTAVLDVTGPVTGPAASAQPVAAGCPGAGGGPAGGGTPGGGGGTGAGTGATPGGAAAPPPSSGQPPAPGAVTAIAPFRVVGKPRRRADGSVVLRVEAPAAGRLTVRGKGRRTAIRPAGARATKRGLLSVVVRPSRAGRALLRKKGRATARAQLTFVPVGGKAQRFTRLLTLRRALRPR